MGFGQYVGDIAKVTSGAVKEVPGKIDALAVKAGAGALNASVTRGVSENSAELISDAARRATKYGIYGAMGAGVVGGAVGLTQSNQTVLGGSVSGAGIGAISGAGAGVVAAAIAKGIRR